MESLDRCEDPSQDDPRRSSRARGLLSRAPRPRILGLPVDGLDLDAVVARADECVAQGTPLRIAVLNHNKCWLACRDPALRRFLEDAELVVAESSVVWGARVLGRPEVRPAWGVALMDRLLARAHQGGWSVYLLGARPEVLFALRARLAERFPGLAVVGASDGYLEGPRRGEVEEEIRQLRPDLLLVAMGSPLQEQFLAGFGPEPPFRVGLGVGGSFDVHAGLVADAPQWVRGTGLEWLWRAARSPRLFRRYARILPWFVAQVVRERLTGATPTVRTP
jgi:N-acetylglucosaminyldiphosphoundecaprenol N-acetyl-beta-D-mannosaminyltransferase